MSTYEHKKIEAYWQKYWEENDKEYDYFYIKGALEALFNELGIKNFSIININPKTYFHPYRYGKIIISNEEIGEIGEINSKILSLLSIEQKIYVFNLNFEIVDLCKIFFLFLLFGIVAMVDFWRWEYNYGHNLDPNAAIIVPGMAYQPPLIGFKQLLNFGAYSIPDVGGWLLTACGLLLTAIVLKEYKFKKAT